MKKGMYKLETREYDGNRIYTVLLTHAKKGVFIVFHCDSLIETFIFEISFPSNETGWAILKNEK